MCKIIIKIRKFRITIIITYRKKNSKLRNIFIFNSPESIRKRKKKVEKKSTKTFSSQKENKESKSKPKGTKLSNISFC